MKKFFVKIFLSLGAITLVMSSFFNFAPKAEANSSLSEYIQNLTPVIVKMPGCKKVLGDGGTQDLFSSIKNAFSSKSSSGTASTGTAGTSEEATSQTGLDQVWVFDKETNQLVKEVKQEQMETRKSVVNEDKNRNCLDAIGKSVVKILINNLTESIINWIQTGDSGGPLFVQDPGQYFTDIAKNEILGFGSEISDPELYPFGKAFMQTQANSFKNKFANNARYSLNEMIRSSTPEYSSVTFQSDFSKGGWGAWYYMTQYMGNNPLGFALMASNELGSRIEEKTNLAQGSLQQSGGYLGVEKCAKPEGVTKEEHEAALKEMSASSTGPYENRICQKWEIVTPGKLIGDEVGNTIMKKDSELLDAETLNDAIAAILDTVLAKFTSSLMEDGLAEMSVDNPYETNSVETFGYFRNETDYTGAQINASVWLEQNPDFNIRTDLNQALIDEQRIYMEKLELQNKEIYSKSEDPAYLAIAPTGNYGLIPTIYQLDYCMPGPNPNWEEIANEKLSSIQNEIEKAASQYTPPDEEEWWSWLDDLTGGVIGGIVDLVEEYTVDCGSFVGKYTVNLTLNKLHEMTGIKFFDQDKNGSLCITEGFSSATNRIQKEYARNIKEHYDLKFLPSVARENRVKFGKVEEYYQVMKDNDLTVDTLVGVIRRLENIKTEIDKLNNDLKNGTVKDEAGNVAPEEDILDVFGNVTVLGQLNQYEKNLTPWKNAFARISSSMYAGDDIAKADNVLKQIVDEKNYIYNNLIKGATGCEYESKNLIPYPYSWQLAGQERPAYPEPHLYEYPGQIQNESLPPYNEIGGKPARSFLGFVDFWDKDVCGEPTHTSSGCNHGLFGNKNFLEITSKDLISDDDMNRTGVIDITKFIDLDFPGWGEGSGYYWEQALGIY